MLTMRAIPDGPEIPIGLGHLEVAPMDYLQYEQYVLAGRARLSFKNLYLDGGGPPQKASFLLEDPRDKRPYVALVSGGWLPVVFAQADTLLLDRNIAGNSPSYTHQELAMRLKAVSLEAGGRQVSPLPAALEGGGVEFQSREQFLDQYRLLCNRLRQHYPEMVDTISEVDLKIAFELLDQFKALSPPIATFLESTWHLLSGGSARAGDAPEGIYRELDEARAAAGLRRNGFPFLLALDSACSPRSLNNCCSPGRAILKPTKSFAQVRYNALSDLFNLELALRAISDSKSRSVFCTHDYGLVGAWAMLSPVNTCFVQGRPTAQGRLCTTRFAPLLNSSAREKVFAELGVLTS